MSKRRRGQRQHRPIAAQKATVPQQQEVTSSEVPEELEAQFQVRLRNHGTTIMNRMLFCFMLFEVALLAKRGG